ncbi:MAG: cobalt-precorrin 5A hydrolase [Oscillospiraceae bacterium]|nr:cobalt-precorrin 5A hydrolase [Oscillospiraceae bacterium]
MNIRVVSYTAHGRETAVRIAAALRDAGHDCRRFALPKFCGAGDEPLSLPAADWAGAGFQSGDALVFCCAAGIAVRAIAPWVRDKTRDSAVLVVDEAGRFVIPLLSGHLGGANELAVTLAERLGATPVLTTATDVNGVFAVDLFARDNHLHITDMGLAKAVSAALLDGTPVGFRSDLPWEGPLPEGLTEDGAELGIWISSKNAPLPRSADSSSCRGGSPEPPVGRAAEGGGPYMKNCHRFENDPALPFPRTLRLVPRRYAAGLGCKRGKPYAALKAFLLEQLAVCGVTPEELRCLASIDLKRNEPGLLALSAALGVPLPTFSAEALNAIPGAFSGSDFVKARTGVDCVCERAAVLASGGTLVCQKITGDGMTFALAKYEEAIRFG